MKRLSKRICALLLTGAALMGTALSGCAQGTDYTQEIKEYQAKLESLAAENEELKAQLGLGETAQEETAGEETTAVTQETAVSGNETQTASSETAASQDASQTASAQETEGQDGEEEDGRLNILVFGDSIWGNYRDATGVAAKLDYYLSQLGVGATVYNAAIGGTRATLDPEDNEYEFGPASENSLAKMISILEGQTDVELLQGKPAYEDMKAALSVRDQIDVVIIAYGMNDFLSQAPINSSDDPWTGFGTALINGVLGVRRICPEARILIAAPTYASYFSIPVQNMGEKALYNYASVACDVAEGQETLCLDAYDHLGIDAYNADEYLEDGVHLNEKGRDLYARAVASCLVYGQEGQISGNAYDFDQQD